MTRDDGNTSFPGVRGGRERVRCRYFERHLQATHRRQVNGQVQEIRSVRHGRKRPGQYQREMKFIGRIDVVRQTQQRIFECQQRPRINVERHVEIDGTPTTVFGV